MTKNERERLSLGFVLRYLNKALFKYTKR